jgi:hypothetical protein
MQIVTTERNGIDHFFSAVCVMLIIIKEKKKIVGKEEENRFPSRAHIPQTLRSSQQQQQQDGNVVLTFD